MAPHGKLALDQDELGNSLATILAHDLAQLLDRSLGRYWCKPDFELMADAWFEARYDLTPAQGTTKGVVLLWMPRREAVAAAADLVKMPMGQAEAIAKGGAVDAMLTDSLNELANLAGGSLARVLRSCSSDDHLRIQFTGSRLDAAAEKSSDSTLFSAQVELLGLKVPLRIGLRVPDAL